MPTRIDSHVALELEALEHLLVFELVVAAGVLDRALGAGGLRRLELGRLALGCRLGLDLVDQLAVARLGKEAIRLPGGLRLSPNLLEQLAVAPLADEAAAATVGNDRAADVARPDLEGVVLKGVALEGGEGHPVLPT